MSLSDNSLQKMKNSYSNLRPPIAAPSPSVEVVVVSISLISLYSLCSSFLIPSMAFVSICFSVISSSSSMCSIIADATARDTDRILLCVDNACSSAAVEEEVDSKC